MQEFKAEERWIKGHLVSYTFRGDEFLPNPDSKLWSHKACDFDSYKSQPLNE